MIGGFVNVLKPPGMSSADVVGVARRRLRERQIGHIGTLDPAAAGVLPLAVGWATRLIAWLPPEDVPKEYIAEALFGVTTDSQDLMGRLTREQAVPAFSHADLDGALSRFVGQGEQIPPMASALHHEGRRLYDLYRAGIEVERAPRPIVIDAMTRLHWERPRLLFRVRCSGGTYVRTLCHDLGERMGCGATMAFLVRTVSGAFRLDGAICLEDLDLSTVRDPNEALSALPSRVVDAEERLPLCQGKALSTDLELEPGTAVRLLSVAGSLLAMGRADGLLLRPACVLPPAFA